MKGQDIIRDEEDGGRRMGEEWGKVSGIITGIWDAIWRCERTVCMEG